VTLFDTTSEVRINFPHDASPWHESYSEFEFNSQGSKFTIIIKQAKCELEYHFKLRVENSAMSKNLRVDSYKVHN
jgi:hypothetical protein